MTTYQIANTMLTFGAFSAVCWRLYQTVQPGTGRRCRMQWVVWGAVHIGLAYSLLVALFHNLSAPADAPHHFLVFKVCLMVLFLTNWRRRAVDRR